VEQSIELHEIDVARRLRGRSDRTDQLREAERERDRALAPLGVTSLAEDEDLLRAELEHEAKLEAVRGELRGLLGSRQDDQPFAVLRDRAANEADECRHALSALR
jgi:uncharacterized protein YhaN